MPIEKYPRPWVAWFPAFILDSRLDDFILTIHTITCHMVRLPGGGDRGPGDSTVAHLLPDAGGVLLVSQVDALVVVEGLDVAAVIKWLDK